MERRTNESPMDWEWESTAPANPNSPWLKHTSKDGAHNFRKQNSFISPSKSSVFGAPSIAADTPSRQLFQTQNSAFGLPQRPQPSAAPLSQGANIFATPRTSTFSSINKTHLDPKEPFVTPETPETPVPRHRHDDETPDATPSLHGLRLTDNAREKILSTTTERAVSGRGELRRGKFTEAASKRVQKRKQKSLNDRDIWVNGNASPRRGLGGRGDDYGASSDEDTSDEAGHHSGQPPKVPKRKNPVVQKGSRWDHHFPVLVSSYLQLFFNVFIVLVVLYVIVSFLRTIQADVNTKVKQFSARRQSEIEDCQNKFLVNRCDSGYRAPALQELCAKWEMCMNQDPDEVGRAKVSAQTFAEILNSLIEPISYKAMFFCTVLLFGTLYITNAAFGIYRAKMAVGHHPDPYAPPAHPQAPPTLVHHPANHWGAHPGWAMPMASGAPGVGAMGGWGALEPQTPSRRFRAGKGVQQLEMR